jgi:hypothetical protein
MWTYTSTPPYAFIVLVLNEESDPSSRYLRGRTEEYYERLRTVNTEAEIRTGRVPKTSQESHRLSQFAA